jgi:hypothetical protein
VGIRVKWKDVMVCYMDLGGGYAELDRIMWLRRYGEMRQNEMFAI